MNARREGPDRTTGPAGCLPGFDAGAGGAVLQGACTRLRPLAQNDYACLYELSLSAVNSGRWRYRGATPSPEQFVSDLWNGVQAQFMIETPEPRRRAGLVVAYNADQANGTVHLGVLIDSAHHRKVWPLEGVLLFVDYLFQHWAFRKVYAETSGFNAAHFGSGAGKLFEEEGRLRDHRYFQGRYWDQVIYSVTREHWNLCGRPLLGRFRAGGGAP